MSARKRAFEDSYSDNDDETSSDESVQPSAASRQRQEGKFYHQAMSQWHDGEIACYLDKETMTFFPSNPLYRAAFIAMREKALKSNKRANDADDDDDDVANLTTCFNKRLRVEPQNITDQHEQARLRRLRALNPVGKAAIARAEVERAHRHGQKNNLEMSDES
jgi:hypothetical protein